MTELNQKIREAKISKLENIQDDYDNLVSFSEGLIKYNEAVNDLFESGNLVGNQDTVMNSMNQQAAIRQALMNEQQELNDQLNALVASGDIAEYTDTWLKWKTQINEVGQSIVECDSALEELKESILEIRLNEFNKSLDNLDFTSDMASSLRGLMSEEGIYDDNVRLTESGIAQLGLMGTELVSAKQQVANYNVAINALGKDLANGNITQAQYNKKLQEYQKSQMDAVKATNSSRQAILDLIKDGIRKETEAMEELISKRKEDLSKQKEYYDYQKKMSDKSKDMNNMRAQIAVLEGDDSLEALSKARKLRSELQELQEEYDEAQKDHEYDVVQDAYDETLDRFKENQEETLYELETNLNAQNVAIADALEVAKSNYQMVYGQLQEYAAQYSITLTDSLTSPWMNAMTAIQQYQASVGKINGNVSIDTSAIQTTAPSANQTVPTTNEAATQNLGKSANGTWVNQGNRWWYQHADGGWTENDWEKIDGQWYKFDNKGWMQTGWQKWNNDWYYLDNNTGAMKSGWQKINDQWYYMDGSGKMLASQWIDNKYYVDHTGAMARNGYIKSQNSDLYYWVNDNGEWEQKWDTRFPDLKKYNLFYSSGTKKAKKGYGFVDDKNKKLDLGSELIMEGDGVLTDYGVLRPLRGDEMIFNDKQREALWKLSNYYDPSTLYSPDSYMNDLPMVTNNSTQEINVHYDNLIGNIEHMDRNTLPDLETILKKSFDYSVKELKKYAKR